METNATLGYLLALGAATCWAIGSMLSTGPVRKFGAIHFNMLRMFIIACMLFGYVLITNSWGQLVLGDVSILLVSGFTGIFLGDTLLFTSVKKLGPRLAGLLFATNAPMTFLVGFLLLGENHKVSNFVGVSLVFSGVLIALMFRDTNKDLNTSWDHQNDGWIWGVVAGLGAALFQSIGSLIAQPVIQKGFDPVFASAIRVSIGFIALLVTASSRGPLLQQYRDKQLNRRDVLHITASGIFGMGVGMTLLLTAMKFAPVGTVAILSATTPIILLPILWYITRKPPNIYSLSGALLVVIGTGLVFA
ncbi:DMT family transporter [Gynuella sp.]|uniref:DMT family transporter n=1 Tax=Gynuella sp. TaxID=2969146 RepID=UPI003D0EDC67